MIAKLKPDYNIDGFTEEKEYEYYSQYDIGEGHLIFCIKHDDNGNSRTLTDRQFYINFTSQNKIVY